MRLDRWLVSQRTEQSRARIQKFIDAGYVRVNGKQGKAKTPLREGDQVNAYYSPGMLITFPEPKDGLKAELEMM
jgi:23S rRNA pseudouridine1911/1915/1917 synthase